MPPYSIMDFLHLDLVKIIETIGLVGLFAIIFTETGLFFGFFLPGDSLLFTAGFLASRGIFNLPILIVVCFVAAVGGNFVGYEFGKRVGKRFFNREDSIWFHKNHLLRAERFYQEHGKKTIMIARFLPVIRVFAPIVAGMGRMNYRTFVLYNLLGGAIWTVGLTSGGFFLGSAIPDVDKYLLPIVGTIIIISFLPTIATFVKNNKRKSH